MLTKLNFSTYILVVSLLSLVFLISCNEDNETEPILIAGKSLTKIITKEHVYLYTDQPVTHTLKHALTFSIGKVVSDSLTVTNYQYTPDSQHISQQVHEFEYDQKNNLSRRIQTYTTETQQEKLTTDYYYDDKDRLSRIYFYPMNDSTLIEHNEDSIFTKIEYTQGYSSAIDYYVDSSGKIHKLDLIKFLGQPISGFQEVFYSNNNVITNTFYNHKNDDVPASSTQYVYLEDRKVPVILKNQVEPFLETYSPILIFNEFDNMVLSYKDNFIDYSINSSYKIQHEYEFSDDGYPLKQNIYRNDQIFKEIDYLYE